MATASNVSRIFSSDIELSGLRCFLALAAPGVAGQTDKERQTEKGSSNAEENSEAHLAISRRKLIDI